MLMAVFLCVGLAYFFDWLAPALESVFHLSISPLYCAGVVFVVITVAVILGWQVWQEQRNRPRALPPAAGLPLVRFESARGPRRLFALTDEDLHRLLLITGRPGSGKTTLMAEIGLAYMRRARAPGRVCHTVTFDANRDIARRIAWWSERCGRETVVIDLGNPNFVTPLQFPRRGPGGAEAACESIQEAWFPFEAEVPTQMRDAFLNVFQLLQAGAYGLEQGVRVLRSPAFRDGLLAQGAGSLSIHLRAWVALIADLPPSEWYKKFWSTLARLFTLLESEPTRVALASRADGFTFERLVDPAYTGPGLDVIVTAATRLNDKEVYFVFGILLNELGSVLRQCLDRPAEGQWPEIVLLADELGRYGAPGAVLDLMTAIRNVQLRAVCACHSLMSLHERLRDQVTVLAANRIAGSETGPGAQLAAAQLAPYDATAVAIVGADGRPTYWSKADQLGEFLHRLQTAPDYEFAVKLVSQPQAGWARPVLAEAGRPEAAEATAALERAIRRSGRPVPELLAELKKENDDLDRRFGRIDYRVDHRPADASDDSWRQRPDADFAPW